MVEFSETAADQNGRQKLEQQARTFAVQHYSFNSTSIHQVRRGNCELAKDFGLSLLLMYRSILQPDEPFWTEQSPRAEPSITITVNDEIEPQGDIEENVDAVRETEENATIVRDSASSMLQTIERWRNSYPEEVRRAFDLRFRPAVKFIKDNSKRRRTLPRTWADYNIIQGPLLLTLEMQKPLMTLPSTYGPTKTTGKFYRICLSSVSKKEETYNVMKASEDGTSDVTYYFF